MKKILKSQKGVTLVETLAAAVIIILLLLTVLGALMFGQGVIVGSDEKNNAAATAQDMIDTIMVSLSNETTENSTAEDFYKNAFVTGAENLSTDIDKDSSFTDPGMPGYVPQQYYIIPVNGAGDKVRQTNAIAYQIYVRVYYNQGQSYVDLTAFNKKGGVWQ